MLEHDTNTSREIIDCDVHVPVPEAAELKPYLHPQWAEYVELTGYTALRPLEMSYPRGAPTTLRPNITAPLHADSPAATFEALSGHVFGALGAAKAIINCLYPLGTVVNPDLCKAMTSAINDWLAAEWLERDSRFRASLIVPPHEPAIAAAEIRRHGGHPGFVQVLLPVRSDALYGNRRFHPVFAEAVRHDLPIGLHFGGYSSGVPATGSGWPTYYLEEYSGMAQVFQSQLRNLIFEGVFDEFPSARVALIESGFAWLPALLWRMDSDWRNLRRETPWVSRPPSEYVHEHVRLTLQPDDGPELARHLALLYEQLDPAHFLMFSTDFPHWHFDDDHDALPRGLGGTDLPAVLSANARAFYNLEA